MTFFNKFSNGFVKVSQLSVLAYVVEEVVEIAENI